MNIVVVGKSGQLAQSLAKQAPDDCFVTCLGREDMDLSNPKNLSKQVSALTPSWVINAAAYTAVDKAETEPNAAHELNAMLPTLLAEIALQLNAGFVHVSTDFVFDGTQGKPYATTDQPNPVNVYGHTKLEGEKAVLNAMPSAIVIRTSWVFSEFGNNFVKTMLRLMAERDSLSIVDDQIGSPTSADDLSGFIFQLITKEAPPSGLLHWTNAGACSWYDFAVAINELGLAAGILDNQTAIAPIPASSYPTPAARPHYSVLDKQQAWAITQPSRHWRRALRDTINTLKSSTYA